MIKIDMWYNDKKEQATGLDIQFNDLGKKEYYVECIRSKM